MPPGPVPPDTNVVIKKSEFPTPNGRRENDCSAPKICTTYLFEECCLYFLLNFINVSHWKD